MHWHVLGTGAIACLWAAHLAVGGVPVTLIARDRSRLAGYHGITLETAAGSVHCLPGLECADAAAPIDRLLVCTKAYDVAEALGGIARRLSASARVVLLQNGMGFHHAARDLLGDGRLFCGVSTEGAWCPAPFHVRHAGVGSTLLGRYPRGFLNEAATHANELALARLVVHPVADIEQELWRKLAVNCAINALTAVHGCSNGALLEPGPIGVAFEALCREISGILDALGHAGLAAQLPGLARQVARRTAANRSSMLQDVQAGRRTEIDFINGFLCRRAAEAGIACPLNEILVRRVRGAR